LIAAGATRAIVADVDWPILRSVYESRRAQPLLSHMKAAELSVSPTQTNGVRNPTGPAIDFGSLAPDERREAIEISVRHEVAQVIGLPGSESINPTLNLFKMGIDSLMAIELKGRLERAVAATLPPSLAFNYPTVKALVEFLDATVAARVQSPDESKNVSELLTRLPNMSGEEVDSLLARMLAEEQRL
jgi:acyl carrier protein